VTKRQEFPEQWTHLHRGLGNFDEFEGGKTKPAQNDSSQKDKKSLKEAKKEKRQRGLRGERAQSRQGAKGRPQRKRAKKVGFLGSDNPVKGNGTKNQTRKQAKEFNRGALTGQRKKFVAAGRETKISRGESTKQVGRLAVPESQKKIDQWQC